jgi:hypothetical protein
MGKSVRIGTRSSKDTEQGIFIKRPTSGDGVHKSRWSQATNRPRAKSVCPLLWKDLYGKWGTDHVWTGSSSKEMGERCAVGRIVHWGN